MLYSYPCSALERTPITNYVKVLKFKFFLVRFTEIVSISLKISYVLKLIDA